MTSSGNGMQPCYTIINCQHYWRSIDRSKSNHTNDIPLGVALGIPLKFSTSFTMLQHVHSCSRHAVYIINSLVIKLCLSPLKFYQMVVSDTVRVTGNTSKRPLTNRWQHDLFPPSAGQYSISSCFDLTISMFICGKLAPGVARRKFTECLWPRQSWKIWS